MHGPTNVKRGPHVVNILYIIYNIQNILQQITNINVNATLIIDPILNWQYYRQHLLLLCWCPVYSTSMSAFICRILCAHLSPTTCFDRFDQHHVD